MTFCLACVLAFYPAYVSSNHCFRHSVDIHYDNLSGILSDPLWHILLKFYLPSGILHECAPGTLRRDGRIAIICVLRVRIHP